MRTRNRTARIAAGMLSAVAILVGGMTAAHAAPKVVSQPGTQQQQAATAPVADQTPAYQAPAAQQIATPVQRVEVVRYVPGVSQAVQPVVVKNVITKKVVYETSPGLAMVSPGGSRVLNPVNVAQTFERNIRSEDRGTLESAGGAAAGGAVAGGIAGTAVGAAGGAAAGAAAGAGAGVAICGLTTAGAVAAPPAAPLAAGCWAAGPAIVGPAIVGTVGATAGALAGAPTGAFLGAQAGASAVPGGRAAFDRTVADTTWDLESQARIAQGAEPLAGQKPGDSMPSGPQAAAATTPALPTPELPTVPVAATSSIPQNIPVSVPAGQLPQLPTVTSMAQPAPAFGLPTTPFAA